MTTPWKRWHIALMGTLLQLCLGMVYAWSYFQKPLVAVYGCSNSKVAWGFSLAICFLGLAAAWGGLNLERFGPRRLALTGGFLYALGYLITGLAIAAKSLLWLYLGFGVDRRDWPRVVLWRRIWRHAVVYRSHVRAVGHAHSLWHNSYGLVGRRYCGAPAGRFHRGPLCRPGRSADVHRDGTIAVGGRGFVFSASPAHAVRQSGQAGLRLMRTHRNCIPKAS